MTEWIAACALDQVPESGARRVMLGAEPVAIVRSQGEIYAIRDVCSHADVALSEGEIEGCFIECWLHGSKFSLQTGEPTTPPAVRPVPVYPVRIEGQGPDARVHVSLGGTP